MTEEEQNNLEGRLLEATYKGDLKTTLECLAAGVDVNCYDWADGRSPLLHAAERGAVECAQALLATGRVDLKDHDGNGNFPRSLSLKFSDMVKGREVKQRYLRIHGMIWHAGKGTLPDMPTWPGVPAVPKQFMIPVPPIEFKPIR